MNKCDGKAMQILHDYKERAERLEKDNAALRALLRDAIQLIDAVHIDGPETYTGDVDSMDWFDRRAEFTLAALAKRDAGNQ